MKLRYTYIKFEFQIFLFEINLKLCATRTNFHVLKLTKSTPQTDIAAYRECL